MPNYLFFLLILACPLMMIWMMRGMHGSHRGDAAGDEHAQGHMAGCGHGDGETNASLEELRHQREQLDQEIEAREAEEQSLAPVGGGWR
jgi:hypothetical protein